MSAKNEECNCDQALNLKVSCERWARECDRLSEESKRQESHISIVEAELRIAEELLQKTPVFNEYLNRCIAECGSE